jgi:hypothetical protein
MFVPMKHYICTGDCGGESGRAGVCKTEGCTKEGDALLECECDDGLHADVRVETEDLEAFEVEEDDYE